MPRIEKMYAFVIDDESPGDEGLIGMRVGSEWIPFVGADMSRIESLMAPAQQIADIRRKPVTVVEFTVRRVLRVLRPRGEP